MSDNKVDIVKAELRGNGVNDAKKIMAAQVRGNANRDEGDSRPTPIGPTRLPFSFYGSRQVDLDLDPREFKGLAVPAITDELRRLLREIDSDFVPDGNDLDFAATELANFNPRIPGTDPDFS